MKIQDFTKIVEDFVKLVDDLAKVKKTGFDMSEYPNEYMKTIVKLEDMVNNLTNE